MSKRRTRVEGYQDTVHALIGLRADQLGVSLNDLDEAVYLTEMTVEALQTLVVIDNQWMACRWPK